MLMSNRWLVYIRGVNVQWTINVLWSPSWKLWVAVQVTTCRGKGILWQSHYRPHSLYENKSRLHSYFQTSMRTGLQYASKLSANSVLGTKTSSTMKYKFHFYFCLQSPSSIYTSIFSACLGTIQSSKYIFVPNQVMHCSHWPNCKTIA